MTIPATAMTSRIPESITMRLELDQDAEAKYAPNELAVDAQPTIFYMQKEQALAELVDVYVRHNSPSAGGQVVADLGQCEIHGQARLRDGNSASRWWSLPCPNSPPAQRARSPFSVGGRTRHFPVTLDPAKKWNFFLVPHTHLDVGYTDYQAKVAEAQSRSLDEAIQMIHDHPEFRFSPDGFWCVRQFLTERTEEQKQLLFQAVKDKKIFVPTVEASLLTGFPTLETLLRSLYPAFEFNQKHGGDPDYVDITDVPSYSWSYASVMAAAGLKYFAAGSDNYRAPDSAARPPAREIAVLVGRAGRRPNPDVVLPPLPSDADPVRIAPTIAGGRDSLPLFLQIYSRPDYKSDAAIIYGTQVENTRPLPATSDLRG